MENEDYDKKIEKMHSISEKISILENEIKYLSGQELVEGRKKIISLQSEYEFLDETEPFYSIPTIYNLNCTAESLALAKHSDYEFYIIDNNPDCCSNSTHASLLKYENIKALNPEKKLSEIAKENGDFYSSEFYASYEKNR